MTLSSVKHHQWISPVVEVDPLLFGWQVYDPGQTNPNSAKIRVVESTVFEFQFEAGINTQEQHIFSSLQQMGQYNNKHNEQIICMT